MEVRHGHTIDHRSAIALQGGESICGPHLGADSGIVKNTVVIDSGVQVNFEGGMHVVRPEGYLFWIEVPSTPEAAARDLAERAKIEP